MSKIHQALRRAEKEGRIDLAQEPAIQKIIVEESKREITESPLIDSLGVPESPKDPKMPPTFRARASDCVDLKISSDSKLVSVLSPQSFPSEQYRTLKVKLCQMRERNNLKTILITSTASSEGKTLTAVNLALTIAQEIDEKVLLVDADLRKPCVHEVLGLSSERGLADLLRENLPADQVIFRTKILNLYITPAGSIPENATELLNTQSMQDFLAYAAAQFDWVILDSPPFVPLAHAELMTSLVDGILIVVRALQTPADLIVQGVQALRGKNVLGLVFNCTQAFKRPKYYNNHCH